MTFITKNSEMEFDNPRAIQITNALGEMIVEDNEPFYLLERKGFIKFMKTLEPRYRIPSRKYMSTTWLDKTYNISVNKMKDDLKENSEYLTLTTDIWTSRAQDSYLGITAHFIDSDFNRRELVLNCVPFNERHTSLLISNKLQSVIDFWGFSKSNIHTVLTDAASNNTLGCELTELNNDICAPHDMHNIIKKCF